MEKVIFTLDPVAVSRLLGCYAVLEEKAKEAAK